MKKNLTIISVVLLLLLSGCSTKKVFEPEKISKVWLKQDETNSRIQSVSSNTVLFEDRL